MTPILSMVTVLALCAWAYRQGTKRALSAAEKAGGICFLHSRPNYYGALTALGCGLPALMVLGVWLAFQPGLLTHLVVSSLPEQMRSLPEAKIQLLLNEVINCAHGKAVAGEVSPEIREAAVRYLQWKTTSRAAMAVVALAVAMAGLLWVRSRISPELKARNHVERIVQVSLFACSCIAIFTTIGIVLSVLFEAVRFFQAVSPLEFLLGLKWSPQMAIRGDQVGASGAFGAVPVFLGTALISAIAMAVAVPIGLMSAIYLSEYAPPRFRDVAKPLMEILAGIPTVVYGFFAAITVAPLIRTAGGWVGLEVASESALAAGLVMGVMIIPFVSSISDDVIHAVPQELRDGSLALGATPSETVKRVVLPAALPGIVGGVLLAVSRAIGETMIVVMAAGLSANLTVNPLKAVTTVTVQIVTLLIGDQEFDSPKTLAAFALGLTLFVVTLVLNVVALHVVRTYREQYE